MRKFAVFDIDGTLIRWQLYHAIADHLVRLGFVAPVEFEPMKTARMDWKRRAQDASFRSYEEALIRSYEVVLARLAPSQLEKAVESVFDEYKDQVYVYTRDLIKELKTRGYLLFAISGSQTEIVEKIADYYGFESYLGTVYELKNDRFTGKKLVHAHHKDRALKQLMKEFNLSQAGSIAVGDSASDIKMLELVEQPIAFNPETELYNYSRARGWKIVVERKNVVYELEEGNGSYLLV
jgi:HAD superfamily hydrolase (TIGR01490 family)